LWPRVQNSPSLRDSICHQSEQEKKMTFANRHVMRIAAVLALTAATTSAFAQSGEYRRGYEDGFAAGQRAARDDRGGPRGWGRVHIEEAEYGVRGAYCDARQAVRNEVERKDGAVLAGNQLCGDPARGTSKALRVVYRCGDSEPVRVVAREYETVRLSCRR
jgi:hypothetical protein